MVTLEGPIVINSFDIHCNHTGL